MKAPGSGCSDGRLACAAEQTLPGQADMSKKGESAKHGAIGLSCRIRMKTGERKWERLR